MPSDLMRGWRPVRAKKTRQIKKLQPRSDSIGTGLWNELRLYIPVSSLGWPRPAAVARDHEQRADDRKVLQGVDQCPGIFGRRLVPEIVEVEGRRDDEQDQQDRKEARGEIDRDHQAGEDLKA